MKQAIIISKKRQIFMIAALVVVILSCSQTSEPQPQPFKDPREMTWTVDTLRYPESVQTLMFSIWASSPSDVWICGHNSSSRGSLWHFDGISWNEINLYEDIEQGALSLDCVWGIDENNIWIVGWDNID